ncbi:hypothetical protein DPEC_G00014170 [Dallia pectoralis]|uniref:Uncharacterized protein n=1 Tax=Dallia pectoralis TaxID=75939 RepID=A0ACC2HN09_DALPE|nr:hypothetical protein DPEC_G00014170 [Dallia pectoralis]
MVLEDRAVSSQSRWLSYKMENRENIINNFKRHSEGTFTNDYANYLDKIKAKDFVQWLAGTKQERQHWAVLGAGLLSQAALLHSFICTAVLHPSLLHPPPLSAVLLLHLSALTQPSRIG